MTLIVRRLLSTWAEQSVTWISGPDVTETPIGKVKPPQSGPFEVDVLEVYLDTTNPNYGVRLALDSDESGASRTEVIEVYSSEFSDLPKRPTVTFKYTH
jgi:hypothetical protein